MVEFKIKMADNPKTVECGWKGSGTDHLGRYYRWKEYTSELIPETPCILVCRTDKTSGIELPRYYGPYPDREKVRRTVLKDLERWKLPKSIDIRIEPLHEFS